VAHGVVAYVPHGATAERRQGGIAAPSVLVHQLFKYVEWVSAWSKVDNFQASPLLYDHMVAFCAEHQERFRPHEGVAGQPFAALHAFKEEAVVSVGCLQESRHWGFHVGEHFGVNRYEVSCFRNTAEFLFTRIISHFLVFVVFFLDLTLGVAVGAYLLAPVNCYQKVVTFKDRQIAGNDVLVDLA
jgi:hypothetical protein